MKTKTRKYLGYFLLGLVIVAFLFVFMRTQNSFTCNLGSWSVLDYNQNTGALKIGWTVNPLTASGCVGAYGAANIGVPQFQNQPALCNQFGFTYMNDANGDGNNCVLTSGSWSAFLDNKNIQTNGTCTHTCTFQNGPCSWGNGIVTYHAYEFSGTEFRVGDPRIDGRADDSPSCTGYAIISPIVSNNQSTNSSVCTQNSDCGTDGFVGSNEVCGGTNVLNTYRTYTCSSNQCSSQDSLKLETTCSYGCANGMCQSSSTTGTNGSSGNSGGTDSGSSSTIFWILGAIVIAILGSFYYISRKR